MLNLEIQNFRSIASSISKIWKLFRVFLTVQRYFTTNCFQKMYWLTLIRVICQPTLKEWLVGVLIPTDDGLLILTPQCQPLVL